MKIINYQRKYLGHNLFFIFLLLINFSISESKSPPIKVIDGDTIKIGEEKIRFTGIDAPEINQTCISENKEIACGEISKHLIENKINNYEVNCISEGKDRYNRTLAECFVNNVSLSRYLVREGYAFAYRKYSKKFIKDEEYAKEKKNGMWNMNFLFPWEYRKQK
tara:strand:+ start:1050 stop:1541 length:492 start_codon:yes stop_codon:yes gene_type:complete